MGIEYILTPDGELYHHGTKGMKWGRRLYQNKDGSLTPLGKKRYAKEEADLKAREKVIKNREREAARRAKMDAKRADLDARENALNSGSGKKTVDSAKQQPKSVKDMSDDEIRNAIARKQLENTYLQYHPQPKPPESFGKKFIDEAVKPAAISAGKKFVENALTKVAGEILKDKVDPNSLAGLEAANKKLRAQIENKLLKRGIDPNVKGENLEKWKKYNDSIADDEAAAKQAKADAKAAKKQEKADAKAAKEKERKEWAERFDRENEAVDARYEPVREDTTRTGGGHKGQKWEKKSSEPKVTVEGEGASRRNTGETKKTHSYDIIDADTPSDKMPAVVYTSNTGLSVITPARTSSGRDYVDSVDWGSLNYGKKTNNSNRNPSASEKPTVYDKIGRAYSVNGKMGKVAEMYYGEGRTVGEITRKTGVTPKEIADYLDWLEGR